MDSSVLVTDFDGTITLRDFYSCVIEKLLTLEDLEPWHLYTAGEITHFEALRRIFANIRATEEDLEQVMQAMTIDPDLRTAFDRLCDAGWEVIIVSNGCRWYIDRLLAGAGVMAPVYSNPGRFGPARGLIMELPDDSPYFNPETGIDKRAVVEDFLNRGASVAFAGDGRPDVAPALLVPAELRFAREWLARHLEETGHDYQPFERWSEVSRMLVGEDSP